MTGWIHLYEELRDVGKLVLRLGEVERATQHPDGRQETDTTHTVMTQLVALRVAMVERAELDLGLVLLFALVHDLVEAIAGDVDTSRPLSDEERSAKRHREHEALFLIHRDLPWLGRLIQDYEAQNTPEARLVRLMDKAMPKLVGDIAGGRTQRDRGQTALEVRDLGRAQLARLRPSCTDLPLALAIHEVATDRCAAATGDPDAQ